MLPRCRKVWSAISRKQRSGCAIRGLMRTSHSPAFLFPSASSNGRLHLSTSGADTLLVHGTVFLEDGHDSALPGALHAKISAAVTVTFSEIVVAPEQPFAEGFIYNAIRKTLDQGQLELVKSGNRQPVPVTTRYYSRWQKKFVFADTTAEQRREFMALKTFWLSGALGNNQPVWIADPRDAQYLNTTVDEMRKDSEEQAAEGLLQLSDNGEFAACDADADGAIGSLSCEAGRCAGGHEARVQ